MDAPLDEPPVRFRQQAHIDDPSLGVEDDGVAAQLPSEEPPYGAHVARPGGLQFEYGEARLLAHPEFSLR